MIGEGDWREIRWFFKGFTPVFLGVCFLGLVAQYISPNDPDGSLFGLALIAGVAVGLFTMMTCSFAAELAKAEAGVYPWEDGFNEAYAGAVKRRKDYDRQRAAKNAAYLKR